MTSLNGSNPLADRFWCVFSTLSCILTCRSGSSVAALCLCARQY